MWRVRMWRVFAFRDLLVRMWSVRMWRVFAFRGLLLVAVHR
jgi:hypothetical protein